MVNTVAASGSQAFEVYAIQTEGTLFNAVVSAKTLPTEKLFNSEVQATQRMRDLQENETRDNVQYAIRPIS